MSALSTTRSPLRRLLAGAAGIALASALVACGNPDDNDDAGSTERVEALAELPDLNGGVETQVTLDEGFVGALEDLGLTPGTTGDAELTDEGALVFPITGGNVSLFEPGSVPNYVVGQIHHERSGFTLTAGDTEVTIANLNVDPGVSRVYGDVLLNGDLVGTSLFIFNLDGRTLTGIQTEGENTVLEGTQVLVSPDAAALLNDAFGTDAVTDQLLVGVAKITVGPPSES